jgi:hypothetical protein
VGKRRVSIAQTTEEGLTVAGSATAAQMPIRVDKIMVPSENETRGCKSRSVYDLGQGVLSPSARIGECFGNKQQCVPETFCPRPACRVNVEVMYLNWNGTAFADNIIAEGDFPQGMRVLVRYRA